MKTIIAFFFFNLLSFTIVAQSLDEQAEAAHKIANAGNVEDAKRKCEAILLKNSDHGKTNLVYAMINEYQKNYEIAELHFIAAEKTIKKDPILYFRLANLTRSLQSKEPNDPNYKYKTAIAYIDKAKAIAPKLNTVYLMYADIAKMYCPGQRLENDVVKQELYKVNMEKYVELGGDDCESIFLYLANFKSEIKVSTYIKGCTKLAECKTPRSSIESLRYVENNGLDYIYQNAEIETCLKLAKIVLSNKPVFPDRVRNIMARCYEGIAVRNKKNVFDNPDYIVILKQGIENDDYDKLKYYDKLIAVYKHKKNETEWKKLELEKNNTECYDLLGEANRIEKEEEKYMEANKSESGSFSKEEILKIIEFEKSKKYYYEKIIKIALSPTLKALAERSKNDTDERIAKATSALR